MTASRWRRIESLYYGALERDGEGRRAYLDAACDGDPELRTEVESLLEAGDDSVQLGAVVADGARLIVGHVDSGQGPPERIGPYRVLEEIGRGGLGTVYLAERDDEHYAMRVAIKLVRRGLDTEDILSRLRQERQILARLDHPNITRLLDGGSTDEGQPYLVMEYVEGETLNVFCDGRRRSLRERLRLALDICAAVGFAHQSLIIHRDIKPSNILVKDDGNVKLLDFGIAKLLDRDTDVEPTVPGCHLLTPEYASPEQLQGLPLTTSTDVYSLGVLLYRLLCGQSPTAGGGEIERPSESLRHMPAPLADEVADRRGTRGARLRQELRGDLDNIVMKALAAEPSQRYGSVAALADDLQRFLENRPVRARPASLRLRWSKFVRRHRLAVVAAALVVSSLLVGMASTLWQARLARQARDVAELQRGRAEAARDLLAKLLETSNPNVAKGEELTVLQVLESGTSMLGQLEEEPELRAFLMHTLGRIYRNRGNYSQALDLHRDALAARRQLFGNSHEQVADSLVAFAEVRIAMAEAEAAEVLLLEALEIRRRLFGDEHLAVAEVLNDLGVALRYQRRWDEAKSTLEQAVDMRRRLVGDDHIETALSLNNLAVVHLKLGEQERTESLLRRVLDIRQRVLGEDHSETLGTLYSLAVVLRLRGDLVGSEEALRKTLTLRRKSLGEEHVDVAASLNSLARTVAEQGAIDDAVPLYRQSVAIYQRALGPVNRKAAVVLNNLAEALRADAGDDATRDDAAAAAYVEALAIHRRLPGAHPETARAAEGLGRLRLRAGELAAAETLLRQAVELRRQAHGEDDNNRWRVAAAEGTLGRCRLAQGYLAEAATLLQGSYDVLRRHLGEDDVKTREIRGALEELSRGAADGSVLSVVDGVVDVGARPAGSQDNPL